MTYLSFTDSIRARGDRHAAKARYWLGEGKIAYSVGSMRKAERAWRQAKEIEKFLTMPPDTPASISQAFEITLRAMEHNLFYYGTAATRDGKHIGLAELFNAE